MIKSSFEIKIRVPKAHSAFTYFQLEANENLCFYSTIEESLGQPYRDIQIQGSIEFYEEVIRLLNVLAKKFPLEFLLQKPSK